MGKNIKFYDFPPLNTDKEAKGWKTSEISFVDCTNAIATGIEAFLDVKVTPVATDTGIGFKNITGADKGPGYTALVNIHWDGHFGGIAFNYDGILVQFRFLHGKYGIRRF